MLVKYLKMLMASSRGDGLDTKLIAHLRSTANGVLKEDKSILNNLNNSKIRFSMLLINLLV